MTRKKKTTQHNEFMSPVAHLYLISNQKLEQAKKKVQASFAQKHQRELAWLLYISEGYAANLARAISRNSVTMSGEDTMALQLIKKRIVRSTEELRGLMNPPSSQRRRKQA